MGCAVCYAPRSGYSVIAQLVEQATVNRPVAGSSPAHGATLCRIAQTCIAQKRAGLGVRLEPALRPGGPRTPALGQVAICDQPVLSS